MEMFDSIYIDIKCPYCGITSLIECQTKKAECTLEVWHKGDNIGADQFKYLDCAAGCLSKECIKWQNKKMGYYSGFGRMFDVRVMLSEGVVTGDYKIL